MRYQIIKLKGVTLRFDCVSGETCWLTEDADKRQCWALVPVVSIPCATTGTNVIELKSA